MLTEEEAKGKWCPHAIASHTDPRRGFRNGDKRDSEFPCIGSACMAWRWETWNFYTTEKAKPSTGPAARGYCGLSGFPLPPNPAL